jgi:hypothetical protein
MRLVIIPADGAVGKDEVFYLKLDLSKCGTPVDVQALQWFGSDGWIEFTDTRDNEAITTLPAWANACVVVWDEKDYETKHPPAPTPEQVITQNKAKAENLLLESDWSVLPDVPLANKPEWEAYRAALREIAINPTLDPTWPVKPETIWQ